MPLVLDSQQAPEGDRASFPQAPAPTPAPSALDVAAAAERQANVVGMAYDRFYENPKPDVPAVPGFDPIASVPHGYEAYADRYLDSQSPQETQWITGRIQREQQDRQTIARAGGWGVAATLAAGSTDPLTIASMAIPVGGEARLANMGRVALIGAGTTAAQEGIAQSLSETRTPQESLTNIGASAVLGGILGSVIRPHVPAAEFNRLSTNLDTDLRVVNPGTESTAGAAAVAPTSDLQGNTVAGRPAKTLAEGIVGQVAPGLRLLTSPSNEARELVQQLAETREMLNKNADGVATPTAVETVLRGYEGDWYEGFKARGEAFRDYREKMAGADNPAGAAPLNRSQFNEAISEAMRRGDQSPIPEVAQAAADTRRIVFDPLKERAQKLGLLPEDVQAAGADSYLMRQYDAQKIRANMGQWMDTLTEGFKAQGVEEAEARDIAYKATRNVLGSERGTMDWKTMDEVVPTSGRLKERSLQLPDQLLEPYLNSDIDHLSHSYLRSLAPEVEMAERFGGPQVNEIRADYEAKSARLNDMASGEHAVPQEAAGVDAAALRAQMKTQMAQATSDARELKPQIDRIRDEYSRLMEQASAAGDSDRMAELDKRRDADIRDISAIRDRLYGTFGQPKNPGSFFVRAGRLLRSDNALRLLGAATLAHVPDIANVITRYGLPNTFKAITRLGTSWNAIQVTRAEARRMGIGLDMVMNSTAALLGDYGSHSRFLEQRIASRLTRGFTIATGETPLITTIQSLASAIGQDELLRNAEKVAAGKLLPQRTMSKLASAGIDRPMLERIASQAAQHGQEVNGMRFGMSDKWKDQAAAQAYEGAILKDAHAMTLSPGVGDTPLVMSTEMGKLLLQFKSFAFAASRHVVMPLVQGIPAGDVRAMTGILSLVAAGYASYWAKQKAAGQPIETQNMGRLAMEVLDKSNLLGWTGEAIYPALWSAGFKDFSRWSDRSAVETIGGPSAGTIADTYERRLPSKLVGSQEEGDKAFSRSDLHFLRRLAPGQNLWYMRRAVNGLEDSVGDLFNLPGESDKDRAAQVASN